MTISLEEFREFAKTHNVVPVAESFLADSETPLTLYAKLAGHRENTFLLESAEHGGAWSRYSFIGVNSEATLTEKSGLATWIGRPPAGNLRRRCAGSGYGIEFSRISKPKPSNLSRES